jgi:hypothetical protein
MEVYASLGSIVAAWPIVKFDSITKSKDHLVLWQTYKTKNVIRVHIDMFFIMS